MTAPLPIKLICATRLTQSQFLTNTLTGRSVRALFQTSPVDISLFPENTRGLSELYNMAIDRFADTPAILVFMHDDVMLCDYHWADTVRTGLERFDLVGIAGNTQRQKNQPGWIVVDTEGTLDAFENLSGAVGQGNSFPPAKLDVFGPPGRECKLMDGLFLATRTDVLKRSGLRFDPDFRFHFYDMDFCRQAEALGVRMGTVPLSVVHGSYGSMSPDWHAAYAEYLKKWKE